MTSLILTTVTRLTFFLILLFSLYLLLRGHNAPGGGFIAGVMTALGLLLQAIAADLRHVRRVLRVDPRLLIGLGLLTSLTTGLVPLLLGYRSSPARSGTSACPCSARWRSPRRFSSIWGCMWWSSAGHS